MAINIPVTETLDVTRVDSVVIDAMVEVVAACTWRTCDRWLVQASQQPSAHTTSTVQPAALMLQSLDWVASLANARQ